MEVRLPVTSVGVGYRSGARVDSGGQVDRQWVEGVPGEQVRGGDGGGRRVREGLPEVLL